MTIDGNKALARVWFEVVMNDRNVGAIEAAYAPDYVHRGPDGHEMGREQIRTTARHLIAAVPDRVATVEMQIAEGDFVVTRWSSRGTHTGALFGRPPTGETVVAQGIVISRIADGRIVEDWEMMHLDTDRGSAVGP